LEAEDGKLESTHTDNQYIPLSHTTRCSDLGIQTSKEQMPLAKTSGTGILGAEDEITYS
jgi:hypothetical protein